MSGFVFENHSEYCTLQFTEDLLSMTWEQMEAATERAITLIREAHHRDVIVMAPALTRLPEGLIASLVRIWKALDTNERHLIFVTESESIRDELEADGLLRHWRVLASRDAAMEFLNLEGTQEFDTSEVIPSHPTAPGEGSPSTAAPPDEDAPFVLEEHKRYCVIQAGRGLAERNWTDVEADFTAVIARFQKVPASGLMVDLSALSYINSGIVAGLVRLWKTAQAKHGQFAVVSSEETVTEILRASGLTKVWPICDDREDAAYALGVSSSARVEQRERALLVSVSLPCSVLAALGLIPMFLQRETVWGINSQLAALLLSSAALATGLLALLKEQGLRWKLSAASVVVSLSVLSTVWFRDNPISFFREIPDYQFESEEDEPAERAPNSASAP